MILLPEQTSSSPFCVCLKANLPTELGLTTYIPKIRPLLEYASPIWGYLPTYLADDLQRIQNRLMDILGLSTSAIEPLDVRRDRHTVQAFKNILEVDDHPCKRFINEVTHLYSLRVQRVEVPVPRTNAIRDSFIQRGARLQKVEYSYELSYQLIHLVLNKISQCRIL